MENCSPYDLRDYYFGELNAEQHGSMERHVGSCAACREELSALGLTRSALLSVPEEEPPRRIAFVSDKVFEPNWWQRLWSSGPKLGFASAALLTMAILVHAFMPPPRAATVVAQSPRVEMDRGVIEAAVRAEMAKQFDAALKQAVAGSEDQQAAKLLDVVNARLTANEKHVNYELLMLKDYLRRQEKESALTRRAAYYGDQR